MNREGKLRLKLFVEGDTEENYFTNLRKNNNVEIIYREFNMGGGGYTSFLKEIRKSDDLGFVAVFIIIDLDRFIDEPDQKKPFNEIINYCKNKNKSGRIPYFLIVTNRSFEFFACAHCKKYKDTDTSAYITKKFSYPSLDEFKSDEKVYEFLNSNNRSFKSAIEKIRKRKPYINNIYTKNIKKLDIIIKIKDVVINQEALSYYHSNIYELFEIIGI